MQSGKVYWVWNKGAGKNMVWRAFAVTKKKKKLIQSSPYIFPHSPAFTRYISLLYNGIHTIFYATTVCPT